MNNYGYTVITTEEYKSLIEDINNKEKCISELNKINQEENKRYKIFENLFLEKMMENQEYYLENMKNVDITDYSYLQLFNEFLKIGIDDMNYINSKIHELKHRYDIQISENEGEEYKCVSIAKKGQTKKK